MVHMAGHDMRPTRRASVEQNGRVNTPAVGNNQANAWGQTRQRMRDCTDDNIVVRAFSSGQFP